jgi:hypothetical protein
MADQALRPLPSASTTLHRADVRRTRIDNILSIGEIQAPYQLRSRDRVAIGHYGADSRQSRGL